MAVLSENNWEVYTYEKNYKYQILDNITWFKDNIQIKKRNEYYKCGNKD